MLACHAILSIVPQVHRILTGFFAAIAGFMAVASPAVAEESAEAPAASSGPSKVVVIPIRAQIAKPELYILRRGLKEAIDNQVDTIVLDMETPGGSVAVTLEIMEALDRFKGRTITYVNDEAMSAGAIIAAVTDEIYFSPTAVIGAAEMIMGTGQDVPEGLKRKMNSYLGAKIRVFAGKQPLRAEVIRAMMDPDYELKIGDSVLKEKGELLSLTAEEALKLHGDPPQPLLGTGIAENIDELLDRLHGAGNHTTTSLQITWSERLAQYLTNFTPILLGLGLLSLFIEFKTPGFGIFGVTGIILLGLVFFGHYIAGLSGHEPALFFLLGVVLVAIELFLFPGTLVLALSGIALMLGSLVWAMLDLWPGEPVSFEGGVLVKPLVNVMVGVVLAVLVFLAIVKFLPKGGPWGSLVLDAAVGGEPGPLRALNSPADERQPVADLVGQPGVAATALFPSGQIEIGGRRYEAKLDMGFAEPGTPVRVTGVSEFSLIVEVLS
jgi:membrane-bound serine protease (ClpP class)